ncbi:hypothetical protein XELAEV_18026198mg [Xenopus laevis]|uniref:Uncharacterized protein n=1 Tax=Xenopus laevis TaxID=8355 RepID=A0A974HIR9_XENLA|nr:hypothetical protein XELAEV_18026198mg [Xenopus laevis]
MNAFIHKENLDSLDSSFSTDCSDLVLTRGLAGLDDCFDQIKAMETRAVSWPQKKSTFQPVYGQNPADSI